MIVVVVEKRVSGRLRAPPITLWAAMVSPAARAKPKKAAVASRLPLLAKVACFASALGYASRSVGGSVKGSSMMTLLRDHETRSNVTEKRRRGLACAVLVATILAAGTTSQTAHADPANKAMAQTLFEEGRRLLASGNVAAACEKLTESYRLEKAVGTLLNVATCHQKQGRFATARLEFEELEASASREGQASRAQFAREQGAALESKISKLSVNAPDATAKITVDGRELPHAAWGVFAPVDPGKFMIEVSAPGKVTWKRVVEVVGEGRSLSIEAPPLADVPAPPPPPAPILVRPPPPKPEGPSALSLGLIGGGIVAIGVGSVFGATAMAAQAEARGRCDRGGCDDTARGLLDDKSLSATIATVGVSIGLLATAAGFYFLLRGSRTPAAATAGATGAFTGAF
jgi:hypothetical protein